MARGVEPFPVSTFTSALNLIKVLANDGSFLFETIPKANLFVLIEMKINA